MTRNHRFRPHASKTPRRGIGSYDSDWQRPVEADDKTVEIPCRIVKESDAALEIDTGAEKVDPNTGEITPKTLWIPRSQIKGQEPAADGNGVTLTMTVWIAEKKGLI